MYILQSIKYSKSKPSKRAIKIVAGVRDDAQQKYLFNCKFFYI